ncbi:MAG: hypothetical protein VKJ46_07965 [Leptolyngbyaceae bacterium]|nr:hypothetical protein [Leptolyngbyaceae bacterium]
MVRLNSHTIMQKVTITLEDEILCFVDQQAQGNRSGYINKLLKEQLRRSLEAAIIAALQEDVHNLEYQGEIMAWDSVVGDGIHAEQ